MSENDMPQSTNGGLPPGSAQQAAEPAPTGQAEPALAVNAQYVKDLSFEAPGVPQIFAELQKTRPDINVNIEVHAKTLENSHYEVTLQIRAECKAADQTAFLIELAYAGVFTVNVPAEHLRPILLIECPRLLFPFAREIVSATSLKGGFLPLMLAPVDFARLYQQEVQRRMASGEGAEGDVVAQA